MGIRQIRWRRVRRVLAAMIAVSALLVISSLIWVRMASSGRVYALADVPSRPVALVLGAQVNADGMPSAFLRARLAMALELYQAGKVRAILVSGDNMNFDYNEPDAMRAWLIAEGVPGGKVVADYAGFDTSDSCQRANRIFGATALIVLTQSFTSSARWRCAGPRASTRWASAMTRSPSTGASGWRAACASHWRRSRRSSTSSPARIRRIGARARRRSTTC